MPDARDIFAHLATHTLRGDIHNLRLALEALQEELPAERLTSSQAQALQGLVDAIDRIEARNQDVLLVTQAAAAILPTDPHRHRLGWVIRDARATQAAMAKEARVTVRQSVPSDLPPIMCDRDLLIRALSALLHNAIRFSPRGATVTIETRRENGRALITIRDQGPGFPPGSHQRLFESFSTGENARAGRGTGLGLGLSLARAIIDAHHGSLWIEEDGQPGGAVTCALPLGD